MRWLGYAMTGLAALIAGTAAFLIVAAPSDDVGKRLVALVEGQTGRAVTVAGASSFTFYPAFGVRLSDVSISAPADMPGEPLLKAQELTLQMPLWPLLQRRVVIERFVLKQPVLTLRTAPNGARSWDFTGQDGRDPGQPANLGAVARLSLNNVDIEDGMLVIEDQRASAGSAGSRIEVSKIAVNLQLPSMQAPATLSGSAVWRGQELPFDLELASPLEMAEGRDSDFQLNVKGPLIEAALKGRLRQGIPIGFAGSVDAKSSQGRTALSWLGIELPAILSPALAQSWAIKGTLATGNDSFDLTEATLAIDGTTATGDLAWKPGSKRPQLTGTLAVANLVLDSMLADAQPAAGNATSTATEAKLNLSALDGLDADAKLTVSKLAWRNIALDAGEIDLTLKDRILRLKLQNGLVAGGRGYGAVLVDGRKPAARLEGNLTLQSAQAKPVLASLLQTSLLDGRADFSGGLLAIGATRSELLAGMLGQGRLTIADGAIIGINIPKLARSLQKASLTGWADEPEARTDFSSLTASFSITKGVARNTDLSILGPLFRATGAGLVDLRNATIDYAARPSLVAALDNQASAAQGLPSLELPVRIVGPLDKPELQPDLQGIVRGIVKDPAIIDKALAGIGVTAPAPSDGPASTQKAPDLASSIGKVLSTLGNAEPAEAGTASPIDAMLGTAQ